MASLISRERIIIESTANAAYKNCLKLQKKSERDESGFFIVEGEKFVKELDSSWFVDKYILSESYAGSHNTESFEQRSDTLIFADKLYEKVSETVNPQGILAIAKKKQMNLNDFRVSERSFYLYLENINDPGNLGTIIRTADAVGASGIFISDCSVDVYNPKTLRASAGSVFHLPIVTEISFDEARAFLLKNGVNIYAAHLKGEKTHFNIDLVNPFCLVIGNEANGITDKSAAACDELLKIPIIGRAESLNAAIAASVILYEAVRVRINNFY